MVLKINAVNASAAVSCGGGCFVLSYLAAAHETEQEQEIERAKERTAREIAACYIADALQIVEQNTARANGGSAHTKALRDILDMYRNQRPVETAADTVNRFLKVLGEEGNAD